jgi:hypothetical protein
MNRRADRFSLQAAAIAAIVALSVSAGVAALFQSRAGIAEPSVYTLAARVSAQSLPMREVVPNRVDVFGVREGERTSAAGPSQGAKGAPWGAAQRREPQAWEDHASGIARSVRPNDRS